MKITETEDKLINIKNNLGNNDKFIKILNEKINKLEIQILKNQNDIDIMKKNLNKHIYIKLIKKDLEFYENIQKIIQIKKIIELQKTYLFNKIYKNVIKLLIIN